MLQNFFSKVIITCVYKFSVVSIKRKFAKLSNYD